MIKNDQWKQRIKSDWLVMDEQLHAGNKKILKILLKNWNNENKVCGLIQPEMFNCVLTLK